MFEELKRFSENMAIELGGSAKNPFWAGVGRESGEGK